MVRIQIANQTGTAEALLNDTVAARDFARRLPCTLVAVPVEDGYEAVTAKGCYDPMESVDHFASGDLVWSGGRLLFCAEGESGTAPGRNHGDRPYESRGSQLAEADGRKTESCRNP